MLLSQYGWHRAPSIARSATSLSRVCVCFSPSLNAVRSLSTLLTAVRSTPSPPAPRHLSISGLVWSDLVLVGSWSCSSTTAICLITVWHPSFFSPSTKLQLDTNLLCIHHTLFSSFTHARRPLLLLLLLLLLLGSFVRLLSSDIILLASSPFPSTFGESWPTSSLTIVHNRHYHPELHSIIYNNICVFACKSHHITPQHNTLLHSSTYEASSPVFSPSPVTTADRLHPTTNLRQSAKLAIRVGL